MTTALQEPALIFCSNLMHGNSSKWSVQSEVIKIVRVARNPIGAETGGEDKEVEKKVEFRGQILHTTHYLYSLFLSTAVAFSLSHFILH